VPFYRGPQPRYLAYKAGTGEIDIDRILPTGQGVVTMRELTWSPGWSQMVPIRHPGVSDALIYRAGVGTVAVEQFTQ
jgi:hypothetical protein